MKKHFTLLSLLFFTLHFTWNKTVIPFSYNLMSSDETVHVKLHTQMHLGYTQSLNFQDQNESFSFSLPLSFLYWIPKPDLA